MLFGNTVLVVKVRFSHQINKVAEKVVSLVFALPTGNGPSFPESEEVVGVGGQILG